MTTETIVLNDDFIKRNRLSDALHAVTRCIDALEGCEEWMDVRTELAELNALRSDIREELQS